MLPRNVLTGLRFVLQTSQLADLPNRRNTVPEPEFAEKPETRADRSLLAAKAALRHVPTTLPIPEGNGASTRRLN
ncbi:MAG TPA: hypothetical protein VK684_05945 [Edaphobacter sp.]|jgi:hypothetical protein|nr:hypothetical protein [Edaphobacter sp.]